MRFDPSWVREYIFVIEDPRVYGVVVPKELMNSRYYWDDYIFPSMYLKKRILEFIETKIAYN